MRHAHLPVALVQRFGIDQGGRVGGAPVITPRAFRHTVHRHPISQRQAGQHRVAAVGQVQHRHIVGEALVGHRMRERRLQGFGQHMHAIGCGVDVVVQRRLANWAHAAGSGIDHRQLRGTVIGEQLFIVHAGQRVARFIGAALATAAQRFLRVRACGRAAVGRRRTLVGRHQLHQQALAATQPLHGVPEDRVQLHIRHLLHLAGSGVAHPQLHAGINHVLEGEMAAVGRPQRAGGAALRQVDLGALAADDLDQGEVGHAGRNAIAAGGVVAAAVLRFQAHAGQLQVRLGHAGDGRIGLRGGQQQALAAGIDVRCWRRRGLEHLEQVFRRLGVVGAGRAGGQQAERGNGNGRRQRGTTDEHPYPLGVSWVPARRAWAESNTPGSPGNGPEGLVAPSCKAWPCLARPTPWIPLAYCRACNSHVDR
ncbi:hypothetical protein D3C81_1036620 [compost metagenome]